MKLTKSQRYTAYCIMLAEYKILKNSWLFDWHETGLCHLCRALFGRASILYYLEELYIKKPQESHHPVNDAFWFNTNYFGWQQRIELLKQCIKETEDF